MTEKDINSLADKIVARMMKIKTMESWFNEIKYSDIAQTRSYRELDITEEEDAIGEMAKLMTLLNIFEDKEEFEKCAAVKQRVKLVNKILNKYSK